MNQITYSGNNNLVSSQDSQNMMVNYTQAITTMIFLGVRLLKFLLLSTLLVLAFVLWLWSISFQTGRLFGQWCLEQKPDPAQIAYKLGEIILFPLVLLTVWSRQKVKEFWNIELPLLSESTPPQKCSDLLMFKKMAEN